MDDDRRMPVVWHQCLLCFIQRYKHELRLVDKEALRKLIEVQQHYQVRTVQKWPAAILWVVLQRRVRG